MKLFSKRVLVLLAVLSTLAVVPITTFAADNNNDLNSHNTTDGASLFERLFGALTRCHNQVGGSPVLIADGSFVWANTDVVLNGRPDLSLTRYYNSFDARDGIFGRGWSARCEKSLARVIDYEDNGNGVSEPQIRYIYKTAMGRRYSFTETTPGSFLSPDGLSDITLSVLTAGDAVLTSQELYEERYNRLGQLTAETDRLGNTINYSYENGALTKIADTNGRFLTLSYDTAGHVNRVTDQSDRTWRYAYSAEGTLASVTNPLGGVIQYTYVPIRRPADAHEYQGISTITDASGVVVTSVTYTDTGRVSTYTEGANTYTYTVGRDGFFYKEDIMRARWSYKLDEAGNKTEIWSPSNSSTPDKFAYNQDALLTSYIDKAGTEFTYEYDLLGRLISSTSPDGTSTNTYVNQTDWLATMTSVSGRSTQLTRDAKGNITQATDPAGHSTQYTWTEKGDLLTATDAVGNTLSEVVNNVGLTVTATNPLNQSSQFTYDARGNLASIVNAAGNRTTFEYDLLDRMILSGNALGHMTALSYDAAGRLLQIIDPAGGATQYAYDEYGRLATETRPDGSTNTYTYRTDNLMETRTDPRGVVTTYTYDRGKRMISSRAGTDQFSYSYDGLNRVTRASARGGVVVLTYDSMHRLASETQGRNTIEYQYNSEGELVSMAGAGETLGYSYDPRGLLASLTSPQGTHTYVHDAAGRLVSHGYPSGSAATMTYDAADRLLTQDYRLVGGPLLAYAYDSLGRMSTVDGKGDTQWSYQYDAVNRLVTATQDEVYRYQYDALGNRLEAGGAYDAFNKLSENTGFSYRYDGGGGLVSRVNKSTGEEMRLEYNGYGRLSSLAIAPNVDATASMSAQYSYDAFGRRTRKVVDRVPTDFQWQGTNLIAEYQGTSVSARYRYDGGHAAAEYVSGGNTYQVLSDYMNAAQSVVSASGVEAWKEDADPYGHPAETPSTNSISFAQGLPGQYDDSESGLSYNHYRYYDSSNGRYVSADPIGIDGGLNGYAYANSSPVLYYDPDGLAAETALDLISVGLSARDFQQCRSIANGLLLALDVVSAAVPFLPAIGIIRHGGDVVAAGRGLGRLCSVEGTPIHTKNGVKPIEEIGVGDLVASKNDKTGEVNWKPVVELFRNNDKDVLNIEFGNLSGKLESLGVTPEHPFWVESRGWTAAGNLNIGDEVTTLENGVVTVVTISSDAVKRTTYNFEVEDYHTYFVGESALWVHNMCADDVIDGVRAANPNLCRNGQCVEFADAAEYALTRAGISGRRVRVSNAGAIGLDGQSISRNGVHEYIMVDGRVFDNSVSTSADDFFSRFAVSNPDFTYDVTNF